MDDLVIAYINTYINPINRDNAIRLYNKILSMPDVYSEKLLALRALIAIEDEMDRDEFNMKFKQVFDSVLDDILYNSYGLSVEEYSMGDKFYLINSLLEIFDMDKDSKEEYLDIFDNIESDDFNEEELIYRLIKNPMNTINLDNVELVYLHSMVGFGNAVRANYEEELKDESILNKLYAVERLYGNDYISTARVIYNDVGLLNTDDIVSKVVTMHTNNVDNLEAEINCMVIIGSEEKDALYLKLCSYFENMDDTMFLMLRKKLESLGVIYE